MFQAHPNRNEGIYKKGTIVNIKHYNSILVIKSYLGMDLRFESHTQPEPDSCYGKVSQTQIGHSPTHPKRDGFERKLELYFNAEAISSNPESHTNKSIQPKYEYENLNLKKKKKN